MNIQGYKGYNDFFRQYIKAVSFLGILSQGRYNDYKVLNQIFFLIAAVIYLTGFSIVYFEQFSYWVLNMLSFIAALIASVMMLTCRTNYLYRKFKEKLGDNDLGKIRVNYILDALEINHGKISSIIIKQYLDKLDNHIDLQKIKVKFFIGFIIILLTVIIGFQFNNLIVKNQWIVEQFEGFALTVATLFTFMWMQYKYSVGEIGELSVILELKSNLNYCYEYLKDKEMEGSLSEKCEYCINNQVGKKNTDFFKFINNLFFRGL